MSPCLHVFGRSFQPKGAGAGYEGLCCTKSELRTLTRVLVSLVVGAKVRLKSQLSALLNNLPGMEVALHCQLVRSWTVESQKFCSLGTLSVCKGQQTREGGQQTRESTDDPSILNSTHVLRSHSTESNNCCLVGFKF